MEPLDRKILRIRAGLTQHEAARRMGLSRSQICYLENPGYETKPENVAAYERFLLRITAHGGAE